MAKRLNLEGFPNTPGADQKHGWIGTETVKTRVGNFEFRRAKAFASRDADTYYYKDHQWQYVGDVPYTFVKDGIPEVDRRAYVYYMALGNSPAMMSKNVGLGSYYLWTYRDRDGNFLERRDGLRSRHEAATVEQAHEIVAVLEKAELRFDVKAGPTGSLFGSVTPKTSPTSSGRRTRCASIAGRSSSSSRSNRSAATPCPWRSSRTSGSRSRRSSSLKVASCHRTSPRSRSRWPRSRWPRSSNTSPTSRSRTNRSSSHPQGLWRPVECRTNFPRRASFSSTAPSGLGATMAGTDVLFLLQIRRLYTPYGEWIARLSTRCNRGLRGG